MLASQRRDRILHLVETHGSTTVDELKVQFAVSNMTLWRDLKALQEKGLVRRVHGGVMKRDFDPHPEPWFGQKKVERLPQKIAIARFAAEHFVEDGHTLCLEGGSTVTAAVRFLRASDLTVLTNSLEVIQEVGRHGRNVNLWSSGGMLRDISGTFVGPTACRFFDEFSPELLFLGGTGLTIEHGITDPNPLEVQAKQAMIRSAKCVIALLDSSKFGVRSVMPFAPLTQIDALITDDGIDEQTVEAIRNQGVTLHVVPVTEADSINESRSMS